MVTPPVIPPVIPPPEISSIPPEDIVWARLVSFDNISGHQWLEVQTKYDGLIKTDLRMYQLDIDTIVEQLRNAGITVEVWHHTGAVPYTKTLVEK